MTDALADERLRNDPCGCGHRRGLHANCGTQYGMGKCSQCRCAGFVLSERRRWWWPWKRKPRPVDERWRAAVLLAHASRDALKVASDTFERAATAENEAALRAAQQRAESDRTEIWRQCREAIR